MQARMKNPAILIPNAMKALHEAAMASRNNDISERLFELINLRVSQINGCSVCVDGHWRIARKAGETDERLFAVSAWRDAPYFTDAERAAFALAEALTRISDCPDPVPDEIWDEAARHYDEPALASLILSIANINVWNRLNIATRQVAGAWRP
ncbi:MAG: carboxymuconolactone decarboxylase family protein [Afipia sp.]|nr:carboxymuconolactone decarboxylase family protein [Afipia sp.]OJW61523.1 MAG: alkylhydroperoxidase [Afipia sp. 64-13]